MTITATMLDYYKKEYNFLSPEKALKFLDTLVEQFRIFESQSDFMVHDHNKQEYFSIDPTKVQDLYDYCYRWHYYKRLEEKNIWVKRLKYVIIKNTSQEEYEIVYSSILSILRNFSIALFPKRNFIFDDFVAKLYNDLKHLITYQKCIEIVNVLIDDQLIIVYSKLFYNKFLEISDDTVRLDLIVISPFPVCIVPEDNPIKFSCFYAIFTLSSVVYRYESTESANPVNLMLGVYRKKNDQQSFDELKKFYQNKNNLNYYEIQKNVDKNSQDYDNLVRIYINRLILHEYFYQVLILSPFQDYYVKKPSYRYNLLYELRYDLIPRLYI